MRGLCVLVALFSVSASVLAEPVSISIEYKGGGVFPGVLVIVGRRVGWRPGVVAVWEPVGDPGCSNVQVAAANLLKRVKSAYAYREGI